MGWRVSAVRVDYVTAIWRDSLPTGTSARTGPPVTGSRAEYMQREVAR